MRGSTLIYVVRMAQLVRKIEKLPHIISALGFEVFPSPSPTILESEKRNKVSMQEVDPSRGSKFEKNGGIFVYRLNVDEEGYELFMLSKYSW